jgi:hypothetical protein
VINGLWRIAAAAAFVAITGVACSGAGPSEWTPGEIKQLSSQTDRFTRLVASLADNDPSPSELLPLARPIIAAAQTNMNRIESHSGDMRLKDRLNTMGTADVTACVQAGILVSAEPEHFVQKLEQARRAGDEANVGEAQYMLISLARDATSCALSLSEFLSGTKSPQAFDRVSVASGEIYAMAAALRAVAGLGVAGLLREQIAANETITTRLARECEKARRSNSDAPVRQRCVAHILATDTLPKLRSALSRLTAKSKAVSTQFQLHATATQPEPYVENYPDDRFDALAYSDVAGCVKANYIEVLDIEQHIKRLNDAGLKGNAEAIEAQRRVLLGLSQAATDCASLATENLRAVNGINTVERIGILVGDIYAIATAFHRAAGLGGHGLLIRQIASNETIVARLGPQCKKRRAAAVTYPCVSYKLAMDALPKLTATLSRPSTEQTQDEVRRLAELTDATLSLIRAQSDPDTAFRGIIAAIQALQTPLQRQAAASQIDDIVDATWYAKLRACVESKVILFAGLEPFMQRLNEARLKADQAAIEAQRTTFGLLALDAGKCYFGATAQFTTFDLDAANNIGVVIGEMYAIDTAYHVMGGLTQGLDGTRRHHIEVNSIILARMAAQCEKRQRSDSETPIVKVTDPCASYRLAADALPKLRSASLRPQKS